MRSVEVASVQRGTVFLDHCHEHDHLMVVLEGLVVEDGVAYTAGSLRVSGAGDRHFLRFERPTRCLIIEITPPQPSARRVVVPRTSEILNAALRDPEIIARELDRLIAPAPEWLLEFDRHCAASSVAAGQRLSRLAREAGVSREHLSRAYRRHFGTTVSLAIRAHRLRRAFDAIVRSSTPLADIASECGFSDQSHMTRLFTSWIGMTPGALRSRDITHVQDRAPAAGFN